MLANQNGTVNSRNYYYPFGGNRGGAAFSTLTTKRFTGQYHEQGLPGGEGLSYYGARWYDAQLGRFASPDTIVPGAGNPQALNRYAYTLNNPLRYMDPTGHSVDRPGVGAGGTVVTQTHRLYPPISSNGGGSSQPLITAWYSSPAYSEWNNPSSFYTGCIKCHAASAWGKPALTNTELADAYERAQSNEAFMISTSVMLALTGFDLLARAEPTLERSLESDRAVRLVNVSKGVSNDTWFEDTTWVQMGTNDAGTVFYGTERDIKLFDVRQVVNRFGPKILVTGGHGGENGEFEKATELYIQDLEFSHSIQVVNFNLATPRQIMTLGGSGQSAFVAWCRSASCETLLELLH